MDELLKIAKTQVNRGAELGLNVKKLSDLETGVFKNQPIDLFNILDKIINDVKTKFSEEQINFEIIF